MSFDGFEREHADRHHISNNEAVTRGGKDGNRLCRLRPRSPAFSDGEAGNRIVGFVASRPRWQFLLTVMRTRLFGQHLPSVQTSSSV